MLNNLEEALPPGAIASDVADDIDIKASEGEFIIPANIVRFIGIDKLKSMVEKAETQLSEMDGQERTVDEEGKPEFATGGLVQSTIEQAGFSGIKTYTDASGRSLKIPVVNGQPVIPVPQGFSENNTPQSQVGSEPRVALERDSKEDNERAGQGITGIAGSVDQWSAQDFSNYGKQRGTAVEGFAKGVVGVMGGPLGRGMVNMRQDYLNKEAPKALDNMLNSGLNIDGTPLTDLQKTELQTARDAITTEQMSFKDEVKTGIKSSIADFWNNLTNNTSGRAAQQTAAANQNANAYKGSGPKLGSNLPSHTRDDGGSNNDVSDSDRDNAAAGNGSLY